MMIRRTVILSVLIIGGCTAQAGPPAIPPSPSLIAPSQPGSVRSPSISPATPPAPLETPSVTPSDAVGVVYAGCSDAAPCQLSKGTWVTGGTHSFLGGLSLTVPTPWSSREHSLAELNLSPVDHPDDHMLLWKDVAAVTSDGTTHVLPSIPRTATGLTAYFKGNKDLALTNEETATIAGGIPAETYVIAVSASAKFKLRDCPAYPRCADLITNPEIWDAKTVFGIGAPEVVRFYLATVGDADDRHLLVIALLAPNATELVRFEKIAEPVIASIRLPSVLGDQ